MDITERKITKIAREAEKLVLLTMREEGVGTAEIDLIHAVRHHPGCTQAQLAELLHADKAAIARRTKNLEAKGLLIRRDAPSDRRSQLLYPTKKAESLRSSKAEIEAAFYEYLTNVLTAEEAAAFAAALDGEVLAMENGVDTVIGPSGTRLSGGQAQRLALARTLAHPRPVLILDDPFSALDRHTEDTVFADLQSDAKDKVVFLISHRLYHFPQMQKVIFMDGGKTTVGTHTQLMETVPLYRQLYESQTVQKEGDLDEE